MKHYIIVKFTSSVKAAEKSELIPEIRALFEKTLIIPGIHSVRVEPNITDRPNRSDLMIVIGMEPAALEAYDSSDAHITWKKKYGSLIESKTIFDSEN